MRRLASAAATLALTAGCGGAGLAPDTLPDPTRHTPPPIAEMPPEALGVPSPSPALRTLAPDRGGPQLIDADDDPRLYEVLVTLEGPRAFVVGADTRAEWRPDRLDPADDEDAPPATCPGPLCGSATLPVGAPAEAALWLAVADLYWRGPGVNRSMVRTGVDPGDADTVGATRQLIAFEPGDGVRCAAQQKLFSAAAEPYARPADPVVDAERAARGIDGSRLPQARSVAGSGQLLLRQRREADRYVLELHVALDHGAPQEAEVFDTVVVCRSAGPIDAGRLPGHAHRLSRDPAGRWSAVVFPR